MKEKEEIKVKIVVIFKNIGVIILILFLTALVILSFGVAFIFLDGENSEDEYKDDLTLAREWIEEHEGKI